MAQLERQLFVDGQNVIHAWPELAAVAKRDVSAARGSLVQRAGVLHDAEGVRLTVVFDGRGEELVVEHPTGQDTFTVVHAPSSLTADDVIEHLVGKADERGTCLVATSDRMERQTIEAMGATAMSPSELFSWIRRAKERQASRIKRLGKSNDEKWGDRGG